MHAMSRKEKHLKSKEPKDIYRKCKQSIGTILCLLAGSHSQVKQQVELCKKIIIKDYFW